jgi:hypothetical protein
MVMFATQNSLGQEFDPLDLRRHLRQRGSNPEDLLTREQTATQLTAAGYRIKEKTLATKASRGGGPPYRIFNGKALYRWADALDWARNRTATPQHDQSGAME